MLSNALLSPSEIYFCIHSGSLRGEDDGMTVITFCPINYWREHECLPDYYWSDLIGDSLLPEGYSWLVCVEETQWCSTKPKEKIRAELSAMGFLENLEMEKFLFDCWR